MSDHGFCRRLLRDTAQDLNLKPSDFSVTKPSLGGFQVEGPQEPNRFYYFASSGCCAWSVKAEAMEHYAERKREDQACQPSQNV